MTVFNRKNVDFKKNKIFSKSELLEKQKPTLHQIEEKISEE